MVISINGNNLQRVSSTKFLGVMLDDKLNWKKHIECIAGKVARTTAILHKSRCVLSTESLLMVYYGLIYPVIAYCCEIWGNTYKSRVKPIVMLQKRCIRIIGKVDRLESTNPLFSRYNVLKFNDIVRITTLLIAHKRLYGVLPMSIQDCVVRISHRYESLRKNRFLARFSSTTLGSQSLVSVGTKLWNSIPSVITSIVNHQRFKLSIKKFYIQQYTVQV